MAILSVNHLTKKFNNFMAVNDVSFELDEGEILGLLGPNGAGKTTTIQMLLGVLTPSAGEICYFSKIFGDYREEILEQVNFSSTYSDLPDTLTVLENLTFISYLYDIKKRHERVNKIADSFNLQPLLKLQVQDLSEGQKTRLNLAKAFINYPRILLLDEPTASLDPDTAKYIRTFLLNERKQFNVSIIVTSHNMAEVEEVCDRVIFINNGRLIANDTPENLAKTIEYSRVELMIKDGLKRTVIYCQDKKIKHEIEGRYIVVTIKEQDIPDFLRNLMDKGIYYSEISIDKPTLEDYFLQIMTTNEKHEA